MDFIAAARHLAYDSDPMGMSARSEGLLPVSDALATLSTATLGAVGVLGSEGVSMDTFVLGRVDGRDGVRSEHVLSGRDGANVLVIDAAFGVADEVVELTSGRDWAMLLDPCPGVASPSLASGEELGIAAMVQFFGPEVATGDGVDLVAGSEPRHVVATDDLDRQRVAMAIPAGVVLPAPALAVLVTGALADRTGCHGMTPYQGCRIDREEDSWIS